MEYGEIFCKQLLRENNETLKYAKGNCKASTKSFIGVLLDIGDSAVQYPRATEFRALREANSL